MGDGDLVPFLSGPSLQREAFCLSADERFLVPITDGLECLAAEACHPLKVVPTFNFLSSRCVTFCFILHLCFYHLFLPLCFIDLKHIDTVLPSDPTTAFHPRVVFHP